jgi:hypothetical protein
MALITLGDVQYESIAFADVLNNSFEKQKGLLSGNILQEIPSDLITDHGNFVQIPEWKYIGDDTMTNVASDTALTAKDTGTFSQIAPVLQLEIAYSTEQLKSIAGSKYDAFDEIAVKLGELAASNLQTFAFSAIKGIFATALGTTHSYTVVSDTGITTKTITMPALNKAKLKLGDKRTSLKSIVAHSKVLTDAQNDGLLRETVLGDAMYSGQTISTLSGMRPFEDDAVYVNTTADPDEYSSYLFGDGAIGYKYMPRLQNRLSGAILAPAGGFTIELARDANKGGGQDFLYFRTNLVLLARGLAFSTSVVNPTASQLATGSNWTKVNTVDKDIRMVQLITQ